MLQMMKEGWGEVSGCVWCSAWSCLVLCLVLFGALLGLVWCSAWSCLVLSLVLFGALFGLVCLLPAKLTSLEPIAGFYYNYSYTGLFPIIWIVGKDRLLQVN